MRYIKIYFPATNCALFSDEIQNDSVESEKKHFLSVLEHVFTIAGVTMTLKQRMQLLDNVQNYLEVGLGKIFVEESKWLENDAELVKMWKVGTISNSEWMEKLRNHHERQEPCPYCGLIRSPSFGGNRMPIDHYLPKSKWPELTIIPTNLVPICSTCNSSLKKDQGPGLDGMRTFLHPYYDRFINSIKLKCIFTFFEEGSAPKVEYILDTSLLNDEQSSIANSHLEKLCLSNRYTHRVTQDTLYDLINAAKQFYLMYSEARHEEYMKWLNIYSSSILESKGPLHWKTAFIRAVCSSERFIEWVEGEAKKKVGMKVMVNL